MASHLPPKSPQTVCVQVSYETAARFAQSNNLFFSEASAVSCLNVKMIFEHLLQEIYNQRQEERASDSKLRDASGSGASAGGVVRLAGSSSTRGGSSSDLARRQTGGCCSVV